MTATAEVPAPRSSATRVHCVPSGRVGPEAAAAVAAFVSDNPDGVLGVATGASPRALYAALVEARQRGLVTDRLTLVALDEYVGLTSGDPRSYLAYVRDHIARPLGVPGTRVLVPVGAGALDAARYEEAIRAVGGVGLQIVGIGRNGHIGFNEPGSAADSRTRVVTLTPSTRSANATFFGDHTEAVPTHALTQGIATILEARTLVLVARGAAKAEALTAALYGEMTTDLPASLLQTHPDVTVVADAPALGRFGA